MTKDQFIQILKESFDDHELKMIKVGEYQIIISGDLDLRKLDSNLFEWTKNNEH